jgi:hypothetical protein
MSVAACRFLLGKAARREPKQVNVDPGSRSGFAQITEQPAKVHQIRVENHG